MNGADENRLQLIVNEISLGFTFVESAQLAYGMGHVEHGKMAEEKAEAAYSGAQRFLGGLSDDSGRATLQSELERLRIALNGLQASLTEISTRKGAKA